VNVDVTNPDTQVGTLNSGYTYIPPPTVSSVSPIAGPPGGGTLGQRVPDVTGCWG